MHQPLLKRFACVLVSLAATAGLTFAQVPQNGPGNDFLPPQLEGLGGLGGFGQEDTEPVEVEARIETQSGSSPRLVVTATIKDPYHIFSLTQPRGGPQPTRIQIKPNELVRVGEFETLTPPKVHIDEGPWKGLRIEEHYERAEWVAPIEVQEGASLANVTIEGAVDTQACDPTVCIPVVIKFTARHAGSNAAPAPGEPPASRLTGPTFEGRFAPAGAKFNLSGHLEPATVPPGGTASLALSVTPNPGWHAYALADIEPKQGNKSTLIVVESTEGLQAGKPSTESRVIEKEPDAALKKLGWPPSRYHQGPVSWTVPIQISPSATAGPKRIGGIIGFQICQDNNGQCDFPRAVRFEGIIEIDASAEAGGRQPLTFAEAKYPEAAQAAERRAEGASIDFAPSTPESRSGGGGTPAGPSSTTPIEAGTDPSGYDLGQLELREVTLTSSAGEGGVAVDDSSILYYLAIAFLGGLILNLMPCVLPVIGLKVMSFVQQAGHSRSQALALNIWYATGIVVVFLALAGLAVGAGLGWGDQFSSVWFNVALASLVFAMALSLLGVWEIPIPGFVGGNSASQLTEKEGPVGAFTKGVFTTILATPCTGPFMATALGWAVQQPGETTFATFGAMGLGMASPYLVIGAFPSLVRFLPKPGGWMVTFKQVMGFVLLGTVVFILSFMPPASIVPTVTLLAGIGLACWWIARIPAGAETGRFWRGWLTAGAMVVATGWLAFGWLYTDVLAPRLANKHKVEQDERVRTELESVLTSLRRAEGEADLVAVSADIQQRLATIDSGEYQAFSLSKLQWFAAEEGRTVLVDFTADWCLTCKVFEATVLHSDPVEKAIADRDIVTMRADYTDKPEHLSRVLRALDSNGVPVIAIFPGNDPYRPFVFKGGYTKEGILTALRQAQAPPAHQPEQSDAEIFASVRTDAR